jgi:uncharacterized damage-inducible protein DinB
MSRVKELSGLIDRTVTGPMWHGPALLEVLEGVTSERAAERPVAGAHSIWELVLHAAVWAEIARARLKGERLGDPTPQEDWPPVSATGAEDWTRAVERLKASYRDLAADVKLLDEARLDETIATLTYKGSNLLHGVVEHGTYHGGQIALLKKA